MIRLDPKLSFSYNNLIDLYITQHQLNEAAATVELRLKNIDDGYELLTFLTLVRDNKKSKSELYKSIKENEFSLYNYYLSIIFDDIDLYLTNIQSGWSQKYA